MALDFPASPTLGQQFGSWKWNGTAWDVLPDMLAPAAGDTPPANPTPGQIWYRADIGRTYIWYDDGSSAQWVEIAGGGSAQATALRRNYLVNPAMQIAQETIAAVATGSYPVDQFMLASGIATVTAVKQPTSGPEGLSALATSLSTAKPSLAATDTWHLSQSIEGLQVAQFLWGTSNAKPAVLRFWAFSNQAGTYTAYVKNNAADRSFLAPFTLAAGAYKEIVVPVPGDITGTWASDATRWGLIGWSLAAGSTYHTGVPGWQSGANPIQIIGNTNLAQAAGNAFYVANVGFYLDPDGTGRAPPFVTPDFGEELLRCQRYWGQYGFTLQASAAGILQNGFFPTSMRTTPSMTCVPGSGTGGTVAAQGPQGYYQNNPNSVIWGSIVKANARL
jgi:hypothetical protein